MTELRAEALPVTDSVTSHVNPSLDLVSELLKRSQSVWVSPWRESLSVTLTVWVWRRWVTTVTVSLLTVNCLLLLRRPLLLLLLFLVRVTVDSDTVLLLLLVLVLRVTQVSESVTRLVRLSVLTSYFLRRSYTYSSSSNTRSHTVTV